MPYFLSMSSWAKLMSQLCNSSCPRDSCQEVIQQHHFPPAWILVVSMDRQMGRYMESPPTCCVLSTHEALHPGGEAMSTVPLQSRGISVCRHGHIQGWKISHKGVKLGAWFSSLPPVSWGPALLETTEADGGSAQRLKHFRAPKSSSLKKIKQF